MSTTLLLKDRQPRKYKICDWERNGYNDSDFFGMYYDEADEQLHTIEIGTTRFPSSYFFGADYLMPTLDIIEKARVLLAAGIFALLRNAEDREVLEPKHNAIKPKSDYRMAQEHKSMICERAEGPCYKCEGGGKFIGRNGKAIGDCFACKGTGKMMFKTRKGVRGADGKVLRLTIPRNATIAAMNEATTFETIYANGYNKMSRHNTSFKARVEIDGATHYVRIPTHKVRLAREPAPDAELRERAEKLSYHYDFGGLTHCAWLSTNFVLEVLERQKAA